MLDSGIPNTATFRNMGAGGFFEKLPDEVVNYYRGVKHYPYGFPSGHSSSSMALWGSMASVFKKKSINIIGITFIFLVAFARLYLGKHFLIDVLGGLVLGIVIIGINYFISSNTKIIKTKLNRDRYSINLINITYLIVIPSLVLLITKSKYAASLIGLNFGFILVCIKQIPIDTGSILKRIIRVGLAIIIFIVTNYLIIHIYEMAFTREIEILRLFRHTITYFFLIWGSSKLYFLMGLYE
jgi:hypothetical protein